MNRKRAAFLDRDGTINEEVGYLDSIEKLKIIPNAFEAVRLINRSGLLAIVVTNQAGIGRGFFDEAFVRQIHDRMRAAFLAEGAVIDAFYFCPHHPSAGTGIYLTACDCRKPEPGMLIRAGQEKGIDLASSYMIGDTSRDVEAGQRSGGKGILVRTGYGREMTSESAKPDYVAEDILDAVHWILRDMASGEP